MRWVRGCGGCRVFRGCVEGVESVEDQNAEELQYLK